MFATFRDIREDRYREHREFSLDDIRDNREYVAMSQSHLDPAKTVIAKAGGVGAVVAVTGKHISRVYRWMKPKAKGGTGGIIPRADAEALLRHAKQHDLPICAADFFPAAPKEEEAA